MIKNNNFFYLFIAQFCGAMNDNIVKNAIVILITYKSVSIAGLSSSLLNVLLPGVFILPFIIFAGIAGQISDKYEKATIIKFVKASEILICILSIYGFYKENYYVLSLCIFLLGTHSTFFGPIKYSILGDVLQKNQLVKANGYVEAGTFMAIILGCFIGAMIEQISLIMIIILLTSFIGLYSAFKIEKTNNYDSSIKLNPNIFSESINIVNYALSKKQLLLPILGISWFWFVGALILSQIPILVRDVLGYQQGVVSFFMILFAVSNAVGSILCNNILKNKITTQYLVFTGLLISIAIFDLAITLLSVEPKQELGTLYEFFFNTKNIRTVIDISIILIISGINVVPLFAIMQFFSPIHHRSRIIAANNFINSIFMVLSVIPPIIVFLFGGNTGNIMMLLCLLNTILWVFAYYYMDDLELFPDALLKKIIFFLLEKIYKIEVNGIEHLQGGKKALIVSNHVSFLDPIIIAAYLPDKFSFAINTDIAKKWWVKPFMRLRPTFSVDTNNPLSLKRLINELRNNRKVAIFAEGRITVTGNLMKIYDGPGILAYKTKAPIIPIIIDGCQYSVFGKFAYKTKKSPKFRVTIMPPIELDYNKKSREDISSNLNEIMHSAYQAGINSNENIISNLFRAAKTFGYRTNIIADKYQKISYGQLLQRIIALSWNLSKKIPKSSLVSIDFDNCIDFTIAFYAIILAGSIPSLERIEEYVVTKDDMNLDFLSILFARFYIPFSSSLETTIKTNQYFSDKDLQSFKSRFAVFSDIGANDSIFITLSLKDISGGFIPGVILAPLNGFFCYYSNPNNAKNSTEELYEDEFTVVITSCFILKQWIKNGQSYDFYNVKRIYVSDIRLSKYLQESFFDKFGQKIYNFYITENGPVAFNSIFANKKGSLGKKLPGVLENVDHLRCDEDGFLFIMDEEELFLYEEELFNIYKSHFFLKKTNEGLVCFTENQQISLDQIKDIVNISKLILVDKIQINTNGNVDRQNI